jgi:L-alanine-DL-glutamate epimerase-like enolase superfamily enzyme
MDRINRIEITVVDIAPPVTRIDATQQVTHGENVLVELFTSAGDCGRGYTTTIGQGGRAIVSLLERELAPRLLGRDPAMVEELWAELYRAVFYLQVGALTSMAQAALDMALWDLRCRRAALPLHRLAGGAKERIPLYNTEYGWLQLSPEELAEGAARARDEGFLGVKIKVGKPHPAEDVARLEAVRDALGPALDLMVDANKAFHTAEAIRRAEAFRSLDLAWFEEPLPMEDVDGHRLLRASTPIPIALGETLYHPGQFRAYLQADAASILQPDVTRVGGITPWLKIAHLAEAWNVAVCPHSLMEIHLALCCAVPNATWLEYMPHLDPITTSRVVIEDGHARPSEEPGLGIAFDPEAIRALRAAEPIVVA